MILSCSTNKPVVNDDENMDSKISEFKIVFFKKCLVAASSDLSDQLFNNDLSYSHDYSLGSDAYRTIDSLVKWVIFDIEKDSIEGTRKICSDCSTDVLARMVQEGMIGKRTLKFCLDYYSSVELDSIAVVKLKDSN